MREASLRAQKLREEASLVEPALAFARAMQRHRDDDVEAAALETRIFEALDEPAGDRVPQVHLPSVLEFVNQFANNAAAAKNGNGGLEVKLPLVAIRACETLGDLPRKRFRAGRTEGRLDTRGGAPAGIA